MGGFGGFFGSYFSRQYDGWSGFGHALLAGIVIGFIGLIVQFLFFRLRPKIDEISSFPWDNTDAPKIQISHYLGHKPAARINKADHKDSFE